MATYGLRYDYKTTKAYKANVESCFRVVKKLIEDGAKPNIKNFKKFTPLHLACHNCNYPVAKYLVEDCDADASIRNYNGNTALHLCGLFLHMEHVVIKLKRSDFKHGEKNFFSKMASNNPHFMTLPYKQKLKFQQTLDIAASILEQNAELINVRNKQGQTVLDLAFKLGNAQWIAFLQNHGGYTSKMLDLMEDFEFLSQMQQNENGENDQIDENDGNNGNTNNNNNNNNNDHFKQNSTNSINSIRSIRSIYSNRRPGSGKRQKSTSSQSRRNSSLLFHRGHSNGASKDLSQKETEYYLKPESTIGELIHGVTPQQETYHQNLLKKMKENAGHLTQSGRLSLSQQSMNFSSFGGDYFNNGHVSYGSGGISGGGIPLGMAAYHPSMSMIQRGSSGSVISMIDNHGRITPLPSGFNS